MLSEGDINTLIARIVHLIAPERIILFGSYAKGNAHARSDLDLLVIKKTELPPTMRRAGMLPLISNPLVAVDVHIYTPEEVAAYSKSPYSFVGSVIRTGRVVYPPEHSA